MLARGSRKAARELQRWYVPQFFLPSRSEAWYAD